MESLQQEERNFTTVIVGGGPETLIFLLEVLKQSKIHDILSRDGCAILERSSSFGPGFLDNFIAKSTKSSALSFLKLLMKHPETTEENNKLMDLLKNGKVDESLSMMVATIKNIASYPKFYEICSPMFRELLETNVFSRLLQENVQPVSLFEAGYFLKLLGNSYLWHLKVVKNTKIFYPKREIFSLRLLNDGAILVTARIISEDKTTPYEKQNQEIFEDYRARRVVLTTVGGPRLNVPQNLLPLDKLIEADAFLQESGYHRAYSTLIKAAKKKVLILGANPTAFACAQLLLKGPELVDCFEETTNRHGAFLTKRNKLYDKEKPKIDSPKQDILSLSSKNPTANPIKKTVEEIQSTRVKCHGHSHGHNYAVKDVGTSSPKKEALEEARFIELLNFATYGSIKGNEHHFHQKKFVPFEEEDITIAYKTEPKIHFQRTQEAKSADFKFDTHDVDPQGEVNSIDGLDADAKALYQAIQSKEEKRIKLLQVNQTADLKIIIDQSLIIIDCQGYDPQMVPIKDVNGDLLKIKKGPNGGYLVDSKGRLISEKGVIKGIYTLGLNFEQEKGEKYKVLEAYNKFSRYDNFESLQKYILHDNMLKDFLQDIKNLDNSEEHYLEMSRGPNRGQSDEKKDNKFDFETMSSTSLEHDQQQAMYSTLRMFEKFNINKSSVKNPGPYTKGHKPN